MKSKGHSPETPESSNGNVALRCSKCGERVEGNYAYCGSCGAPSEHEHDSEVPSKPKSFTALILNKREGERWFKNKRIILLSSIALLMIFGATGWKVTGNIKRQQCQNKFETKFDELQSQERAKLKDAFSYFNEDQQELIEAYEKIYIVNGMVWEDKYKSGLFYVRLDLADRLDPENTQLWQLFRVDPLRHKISMKDQLNIIIVGETSPDWARPTPSEDPVIFYDYSKGTYEPGGAFSIDIQDEAVNYANCKF